MRNWCAGALAFGMLVVLLVASCGQSAGPKEATPAVSPPGAAQASTAGTPEVPSPAPVASRATAEVAPPAPNAERTATAALGERALDFVRTLASGLGPRDTESGGERRAAKYLSDTFRAAGLQVSQQPFSVTVYSRQAPLLEVVTPQARVIEAEPLRLSGEGEVQGPLAFVGLGKSGDFPPGGLGGKVALVERGEIRFQEKVDNASRAGAVAAVVYNNAPGPLFGALASKGAVPAVGMSRSDGQALRELLAGGEVVVRVRVQRVELASQNVVAELPGTGKGVVVIGGHYDSVPVTGGANDNASGTAVLLALASELSGRPFPFSVRLVGFGAEELGLWGSRAYVSALSQEERSLVQAVLNLDVLGSNVPLSIGGDPALRQELQEIARAEGMELPSVQEDVPSDHLSFVEAGIPAIILTTPDFSLIHTPRDTVEKVSPQPLGQAATLVLRFLEKLARQPSGQR